jgi:hypothetical protein
MGSQNSVLISESVVGFKVAATRQNVGRLAIVAFGFVAPGGVKLPVTTTAVVTDTFSSESDVKPSHD